MEKLFCAGTLVGELRIPVVVFGETQYEAIQQGLQLLQGDEVGIFVTVEVCSSKLFKTIKNIERIRENAEHGKRVPSLTRFVERGLYVYVSGQGNVNRISDIETVEACDKYLKDSSLKDEYRALRTFLVTIPTSCRSKIPLTMRMLARELLLIGYDLGKRILWMENF